MARRKIPEEWYDGIDETRYPGERDRRQLGTWEQEKAACFRNKATQVKGV